MIRLQSIWRTLKVLVLTAVCWAAVYGRALAQPGAEEKKGSGATLWTMSYFLVIFGVGLGLLVVLRSSRRRDRARPQAYSGVKLAEEEDEEPD